MEEIIRHVEINNPQSITDYRRLARELVANFESSWQGAVELRLAVLASFTLKGLADILFVECARQGIKTEVYLGEYNQYAQEILNPTSGLHSFKPSAVVLFIDTQALLGEAYFRPYGSLQAADRRLLIDEKLAETQQYVQILRERTGAVVIVHNAEVPGYSPLGILEAKQEFGIVEAVESFNRRLNEFYKSVSDVFVFDYNAWCSRWGKSKLVDYPLYYLGDFRLGLEHLAELARAYLHFIKPLAAKIKKCIVLDLDNTLWGGVVGEDGVEALRLGPTPEGRPFWEFQKYLLALLERGVILAINSKNNLEDALRVLREHPHMILREQHFAALAINWNDKATNLKQLAEELNIGLDSLVFIDDDAANRALVRESLPQVEVVELPKDPSRYASTLKDLNSFQTLSFTTEDAVKGKIYAAERERREFQNVASDLSGFLRGLGMAVTARAADAFSLPRLAQLTQKTNQFNLTTRRYREEQLAELANRPDRLVLGVEVKDRFGDNGLVGVAIVEKTPQVWNIDTFLLSCRVIGRGVEQALVGLLINRAREAGVEFLTGEFIATSKNAPAKDFYALNGFKLQWQRDGVESWQYAIEQPFIIPDYLTLVEN